MAAPLCPRCGSHHQPGHGCSLEPRRAGSGNASSIHYYGGGVTGASGGGCGGDSSPAGPVSPEWYTTPDRREWYRHPDGHWHCLTCGADHDAGSACRPGTAIMVPERTEPIAHRPGHLPGCYGWHRSGPCFGRQDGWQVTELRKAIEALAPPETGPPPHPGILAPPPLPDWDSATVNGIEHVLTFMGRRQPPACWGCGCDDLELKQAGLRLMCPYCTALAELVPPYDPELDADIRGALSRHRRRARQQSWALVAFLCTFLCTTSMIFITLGSAQIAFAVAAIISGTVLLSFRER